MSAMLDIILEYGNWGEGGGESDECNMFFFLVSYRSPANIKAERTTGVPGRSSNLATSRVLLDLFIFFPLSENTINHQKPCQGFPAFLQCQMIFRLYENVGVQIIYSF